MALLHVLYKPLLKDDSVSQYVLEKALLHSFDQNCMACPISLFGLAIRNLEIILIYEVHYL